MQTLVMNKINRLKCIHADVGGLDYEKGGDGVLDERLY